MRVKHIFGKVKANKDQLMSETENEVKPSS